MYFSRLRRFSRFTLNFRTKTSQSAEDRRRWVEYRKGVTQLRKQFHDEWLARQRQSSTITVEEREAVRREKESFTANRLENERMVKWRAEKLSVETKKQEVVKEQKKERHLERLSKLHELRQAVVQKIKDEEDYITAENLDEKIAEALENPRDYNFALTRSGEVLTAEPKKHNLLPVQGW